MNRISFLGHVNLAQLFWLRCLAIIGQLVTIDIATRFFGVTLPIAAMLVIIGMETLFNALTWWRVSRATPETNYELFGQLLVDLAALSALLFLSGGTTNPFVSLYLPALAIGAAVLPRALIICLALFAVSGYGLLSLESIPLSMQDPGNLFDYYRTGVWINFMVSVALIVWFVARISRALRARDAALADAHARLLRDERVVALGAQAASVAHEIGTPLSTMALVAEELLAEAAVEMAADTAAGTRSSAGAPAAYAATSRAPAAATYRGLSAYREDLLLLEQQIGLCKSALARLQSRAHLPVRQRLADWLDGFTEQWRLRHPQVQFSRAGANPPPLLFGDTVAIGQILTILLDNAARASPSAVLLETAAHGDTMAFRVIDRGAGMLGPLRAQVGKAPVQSTQGGQGVGLYLAFATAGQLGGSIELTDVAEGGTCAALLLPQRTEASHE
ncbi:MAG: ATP-binding protein [Janthinobacterium lividum]